MKDLSEKDGSELLKLSLHEVTLEVQQELVSSPSLDSATQLCRSVLALDCSFNFCFLCTYLVHLLSPLQSVLLLIAVSRILLKKRANFSLSVAALERD